MARGGYNQGQILQPLLWWKEGASEERTIHIYVGSPLLDTASHPVSPRPFCLAQCLASNWCSVNELNDTRQDFGEPEIGSCEAEVFCPSLLWKETQTNVQMSSANSLKMLPLNNIGAKAAPCLTQRSQKMIVIRFPNPAKPQNAQVFSRERKAEKHNLLATAIL